jgi:hypothetical protein
MLVIHWTEHKNIKDIKANGLSPSVRIFTSDNGSGLRTEVKDKGIWCYPFTRNKTLNNQWKRNLKVWERRHSNFNGVIFRLSDEDFPLYAGVFSATAFDKEYSLVKTMKDLKQTISGFPANQLVDFNNVEIDTDEFEIIILTKIPPERIVKVIKDREKIKRNVR